MKNCENCNIEHNGTYGSGRFCSTKCSRGFSTKAKRKEINAKVALALAKTIRVESVVECKSCKNEFLTNYYKNCTNCRKLNNDKKVHGKVVKLCVHCNSAFYVYNCYVNKTNYCSTCKNNRKYTKTVLKKVNTRIKKRIEHINYNCTYCNTQFVSKWTGRKYLEYCSTDCKTKAIRKKQSIARIKNIQDGITNNNGIKMTYFFNGNTIKCDSKLEYSCIDWFIKTYKVLSIERCQFFIEYDDNDNIQRRYLPDFTIQTIDKILIVECKSDISLTVENTSKQWKRYKELAIIKKQVLENYCKLNGYESFWFTKKIHYKFYKSITGKIRENSCSGKTGGC